MAKDDESDENEVYSMLEEFIRRESENAKFESKDESSDDNDEEKRRLYQRDESSQKEVYRNRDSY